MPVARGWSSARGSCGGTSRGPPRCSGLVRDGAIGELRLIRASFSFPLADDPWRLSPEHGGGALSDVGCYVVNAARLFAGREPVEVRSFAKFGPTGRQPLAHGRVAVPRRRPRRDRRQLRAAPRNTYELVGSRGSIRVPDAFVPPKRPLADLGMSMGSPKLRFGRTNPYAAMFDDFARAVAGIDQSPPDRPEAQLTVLDAIRAGFG